MIEDEETEKRRIEEAMRDRLEKAPDEEEETAVAENKE
jgi:hypothetical protein